MGFERFSGIAAPEKFLKAIVRFHKESFPEAELFRQELERMIRGNHSLDAAGLGIELFGEQGLRDMVSDLNENVFTKSAA